MNEVDVVIFTAVAAGVDGSTGTEERRCRGQDALCVRQSGAGASVAATGGVDPGWHRHDTVSAPHQSAHATRPVTARPSLQTHGGSRSLFVVLTLLLQAIIVCIKCS